jgi:hypothetical protein
MTMDDVFLIQPTPAGFHMTQLFKWLSALLCRSAPPAPTTDEGRCGGIGTFSIGE